MPSANDPAWIAFLQWALPRGGFRWRGFRRVRRQVIRRIAQRVETLGLDGPEAYRAYLEANPTEWIVFEWLCRVTISRFFRDRGMFAALEHELDAMASKIGRGTLRVWSVGCASGEEPYTIAIIWHTKLEHLHPEVRLDVLGTDIDPDVLQRGQTAVYGSGSIKEVPHQLRDIVFDRRGEDFVLRPRFKASVHFERHDIRDAPAPGPFHVIACRNLAFTYFDPSTQAEVLERLLAVLVPGGLLILGSHETPPPDTWPLVRPGRASIWRHEP